jgi:hypothetical protein
VLGKSCPRSERRQPFRLPGWQYSRPGPARSNTLLWFPSHLLLTGHHQAAPAIAGIRLAAHMGASPIGLIGIDFHTAAPNSARNSYFHKAIAEREAFFSELAATLQAVVVNLSEISMVQTFPRMSVPEFARRTGRNVNR